MTAWRPISAAFLAVAVLAAPALADQRQRDGQMWGAERQAVPYPLPADFNECVVSVVKPEYREKWGRVSVFRPPLTDRDRHAIDYARRNSIATARYCDERES